MRSRFQALLLLLELLLASAQAQTTGTGGDIPLTQKRFPWPNLPYQADTGKGERGPQSGYNICNSTTQNQQSKCQTSFLDSISDFCLWGAQKPNSIVGDVEGDMVAFCTLKQHGARMLTSGSITGIQLMRTPGYIQVIGYIDQTTLNIQANDAGGEEDPKGADFRGNPLGGLVYSSAFNKPETKGFTQVIDWTYFIGSGVFCFKACDPAGPNAASLCEHVYDRIGCEYNMPADYAKINGTFQACKGDDQLPVGVYMENGVKKTWKQPPEEQGPIANIPYRPVIPASSECVTYASTAIFTELVGAPAAYPTPIAGRPAGVNVTSGNLTGTTNTAGGPFPAQTGKRSAGNTTLSISYGLLIAGLASSLCLAIGAGLVHDIASRIP